MIPIPNMPKNSTSNNFLAIAPSKNLGCFSIEPTITITQTIRAKTGIVIINQSNSEVIAIILPRIASKSREGLIKYHIILTLISYHLFFHEQTLSQNK